MREHRTRGGNALAADLHHFGDRGPHDLLDLAAWDGQPNDRRRLLFGLRDDWSVKHGTSMLLPSATRPPAPALRRRARAGRGCRGSREAARTRLGHRARRAPVAAPLSGGLRGGADLSPGGLRDRPRARRIRRGRKRYRLPHPAGRAARPGRAAAPSTVIVSGCVASATTGFRSGPAAPAGPPARPVRPSPARTVTVGFADPHSCRADRAPRSSPSPDAPPPRAASAETSTPTPRGALPRNGAHDRREERAVALPACSQSRGPAILHVRREHRGPAQANRPERQQRIAFLRRRAARSPQSLTTVAVRPAQAGRAREVNRLQETRRLDHRLQRLLVERRR